jgi:hypothetical protein
MILEETFTLGLAVLSDPAGAGIGREYTASMELAMSVKRRLERIFENCKIAEGTQIDQQTCFRVGGLNQQNRKFSIHSSAFIPVSNPQGGPLVKQKEGIDQMSLPTYKTKFQMESQSCVQGL